MPRIPALLHQSRKQQKSRQHEAVAESDSANDDRQIDSESNEVNQERAEEIGRVQKDQTREHHENDGARRRIASRSRSKSHLSKSTAAASADNRRFLNKHASTPRRVAASSDSGGVESDELSESYRLPSDSGADAKSDGFHTHDEEDIDGNHDDFSPPDDSPYAQVRASVSPTDDLSLSINTPRMWTLSLLFAVLGSSTNLFFSLRYPSVSLSPIIALLLVHPLGLVWDRLLKRTGDPEEIFVHGSLDNSSETLARGDYDSLRDSAHRFARSNTGLFSSTRGSSRGIKREIRLWLAQGRWNEKEHTCVYISSNISFGFAFATDVSGYAL